MRHFWYALTAVDASALMARSQAPAPVQRQPRGTPQPRTSAARSSARQDDFAMPYRWPVTAPENRTTPTCGL